MSSDYKDRIVGYYVTGPHGRQDFQVRKDAEAAYEALSGGFRAIGRWRERIGPDQPLLVAGELTHRRQRSRYGDLIRRED